MNFFIPIFDSNKKNTNEFQKDTYPLDEDCLNFLNENFNADYYFVCVGDIPEYTIPSKNKPFRLKPELQIIIYDRMGQKVFSKLYSYEFNKIPESETLVKTYYKYLNETIISNKNNINEDLSFLKNFTDVTNSLLFNN